MAAYDISYLPDLLKVRVQAGATLSVTKEQRRHPLITTHTTMRAWPSFPEEPGLCPLSI